MSSPCEHEAVRRLLPLFLGTALLAPALRGWQDPGAPPREEVRAVWLTTASGLDWPRTTNRAEQQASLRTIVRTLAAANFNTLFFQVRARGDAYYASPYEPWAENLTGQLGRDPGWDPLSFLLEEAHAAGIEVHAWFNVFKVKGAAPIPSTSPPHPARANPQWVIPGEGEGWLDPGLPDAREYTMRVALDLIRRYDIDGVNLDFIRYPGGPVQDDDSYRRYGRGAPRDEWRRQNITRFVSELSDRAATLRPTLKLGASPFGVYGGEIEGLPGSCATVFQDTYAWLRAGKLDYVSPQIYWSLSNGRGGPDFAVIVREWLRNAAGRHVYPGIGAYKPEVFTVLGAHVDVARAAGAQGQAFYRYESLRSVAKLASRYRTRALLPRMPWKGGAPPPPPRQIAVTDVTTNVFQVEWLPPAAGGAPPRWFCVYRASTPMIPLRDPSTIVRVVPDGTTAFFDTVRVPTGLTYYYTVTALDRAGNESRPPDVSSGIVRELLDLKGRLTDITSLSTSFGNHDGRPGIAAYRLARRLPVHLGVYARTAGGRDSLAAQLVDGVQDAGVYLVGLGQLPALPGALLRLRAGDTVLEHLLPAAR